MIGNVKRDRDIYDLIHVILLRLNDKTEVEDSVLKLLQVISSNHLKKEEKIKFLHEAGIRMDSDMEEGVSHMCNAGDWIERQATERTTKEVTEQITEKAAKGFIELCQELGMSKETAETKIKEKFSLSTDSLPEYMKKYWN
ncbi:MAG: hypothetical protein Q4F29_11865 [Lachnospiraceae bacterium]|nr:hypothetical protein [Lachnospiraceae bacterium]